MARARPFDASRLAGWGVFAMAFGFVEATVVTYLRALLAIRPGVDYAAALAHRSEHISSTAVYGLLASAGVLRVEVLREAATMLLLAGAAWAAGRSARGRWALFGLAFALWDLSYYLFLFLETGFPRSLASTDIYFLIPVAWYGPVWLPVLVIMPAIVAVSLWALWTPPAVHSAEAPVIACDETI